MLVCTLFNPSLSWHVNADTNANASVGVSQSVSQDRNQNQNRRRMAWVFVYVSYVALLTTSYIYIYIYRATKRAPTPTPSHTHKGRRQDGDRLQPCYFLFLYLFIYSFIHLFVVSSLAKWQCASRTCQVWFDLSQFPSRRSCSSPGLGLRLRPGLEVLGSGYCMSSDLRWKGGLLPCLSLSLSVQTTGKE